jgi:hypothetical protein
MDTDDGHRYTQIHTDKDETKNIIDRIYKIYRIRSKMRAILIVV